MSFGSTVRWIVYWFYLYPAFLARRIPGTGEPGGLPSMGSHRVGHDWSDLASTQASLYKNSSYVILVHFPQIFYLFIYWLHSVFDALLLPGLSPLAVNRDYSSLQCAGFSLRWLILFQNTSSMYAGSVAVVHGALVAPWHVESSWTRNRTRVPWIGRQIPSTVQLGKSFFRYFLKGKNM